MPFATFLGVPAPRNRSERIGPHRASAPLRADGIAARSEKSFQRVAAKPEVEFDRAAVQIGSNQPAPRLLEPALCEVFKLQRTRSLKAASTSPAFGERSGPELMSNPDGPRLSEIASCRYGRSCRVRRDVIAS